MIRRAIKTRGQLEKQIVPRIVPVPKSIPPSSPSPPSPPSPVCIYDECKCPFLCNKLKVCYGHIEGQKRPKPPQFNI